MKHFLRAGGALLGLLFVLVLGIGTASAATTYQINPATVTVRSGESVDFTVVKSTNGVETDVTADATLTVEDPTGITAGGTYTAGTIGTWKLTATVNGATTTATVTVTPGEVSRVRITPHDDPVRIEKGKNQQFVVTAYDDHNNVITDAKITWSGAFSLGTISKTGLFTATKTGGSQIIAQSGNAIDTVPVTVFVTTPANTNTTVTPATSNANTNQSNSNDNTNAAEQPTPTTTGTDDDTSNCSSLPWWAWLGITIALLALVYVYHYLIRKKRSSLWLLGTVALCGIGLWFYFSFRCGNEFTWVAWMIAIGTGILAVLRPQTFQTNYGSDL